MSRLMTYGRNILILAIVFLVSSLAINLISPIWPIYIKSSLGASMTELGFVFSVSNAVAATTQILTGFLSDKYGRRYLHALGTLLAAFPPLMYAMANQWTDLVPWVSLSGIAVGLYLPMRWAIVADVSSSETMALAYSWINISWLIGNTVGPLVGGIAADMFGIRFPFFLSFTLIIAVFPLTLLMQETRRKSKPIVKTDEYTKSEASSGFIRASIPFSLINILQGTCIGSIIPALPVFTTYSFNVDYTFVGILYAIGFGIASLIVQIPGGKLSNLFDRRKVMLLTFLASSPFFMLTAYSQNIAELILFCFLANAILGLSWSSFQTLMMESTPHSKWGLINGVAATTFWIGLMAGNALSGILWDNWGMWAPFHFSALMMGLSVLPLIPMKETKVSKEHSLSTS